MKKIFAFMLCAIALVTITSCTQSLSEQEKAIKAKVEELKKQGWKVVGDENLTTVVSKHMEKLYDGSDSLSAMVEHVGYSSDDFSNYHCDNIESGKIAARNHATDIMVEAYTKIQKESFPAELLDKFDAYRANFRSIYAQKMAAELIPSFFLYKKSNDRYLVVGYFLVNRIKDMKITTEAEKEAADLVGKDIIDRIPSTLHESNQ